MQFSEITVRSCSQTGSYGHEKIPQKNEIGSWNRRIGLKNNRNWLFERRKKTSREEAVQRYSYNVGEIDKFT
ncbi:MAG: hypothetical protein ACLFUR_05045 [Candidatus Hadarchaeia archaeon]